MPDLERLAGAVLCVGFDGTTPQEAPLGELAELAAGGVVLFGRNVESVDQTRSLAESVSAAIAHRSGAAPFVAIDQEGGRVARLRRGAHEIPSMMALGATDDVALAERVGVRIASDLRRAGVTVDFAPVLDLALEPENTVIGARSFGDDPERVAALGSAVVRGLQRGGVAATVKHFPGHGGTTQDSHESLPAIGADAATLRTRDLVPFVRAIAAGAQATMTAHVVVRSLDALRPATLSPRVLTGLLRGELGFDGVCFTDCLEMDAIAAGPGTARGAVLALAAGADCVTISQSLERAREARDAIVAAVHSGELPRARLDEATARIARLHKASARVVDGDVEVDDTGAEAARRAVTVLRAPSRGDALLRAGDPVTVISFEGETSEGAVGKHADHASLSLALRERRVRSEMLRAPLDPTSEMTSQLVALASAQHARRFVFLMRRAHLHPAQRAALEALLAAVPDAILVSLREPYDAPLFGAARTVLCTYGDEQVSIDGLADVLTGRSRAEGRLPVRLSTVPCPG